MLKEQSKRVRSVGVWKELVILYRIKTQILNLNDEDLNIKSFFHSLWKDKIQNDQSQRVDYNQVNASLSL